MTDHHEPADVIALRAQLRIDNLEREVHELRQDVRDLVEAWNTARGILKFVRLVGAIGVAVGGILTFFHLSQPK